MSPGEGTYPAQGHTAAARVNLGSKQATSCPSSCTPCLARSHEAPPGHKARALSSNTSPSLTHRPSRLPPHLSSWQGGTSCPRSCRPPTVNSCWSLQRPRAGPRGQVCARLQPGGGRSTGPFWSLLLKGSRGSRRQCRPAVHVLHVARDALEGACLTPVNMNDLLRSRLSRGTGPRGVTGGIFHHPSRGQASWGNFVPQHIQLPKPTPLLTQQLCQGLCSSCMRGGPCGKAGRVPRHRVPRHRVPHHRVPHHRKAGSQGSLESVWK